MFSTNPLGRLFNKPRKSRSTPNRQALTEYLNSVTALPPLPPPTEILNQQQHQHHDQNEQQKHYTFPLTNKSRSQLENGTSFSNSHVVTPMLITSSFYNQEYPFDDNSSVEEEDEPVNDNLNLLPPQQYFNQQQQQQIPEAVMANYLQQKQQNTSSDTATKYINIPRQQNSLYYTERENISYNTQVPQPQEDNKDSPDHRPFKRIPTPYAYHNDHDSDEYSLQKDYEKVIDDRHHSGFQQLKNDFKELEKKLKEIEYLLFSRSYESVNEYASSKYFNTSPKSWVDTSMPTVNDSNNSYPYYYYNNSNYGADYYYANHTPSSYQQRYASAGPSFTNISRHNLNSNSDSSGNRYSLEIPVVNDNSNNSMTEDTMMHNYYIQQQQQRYYNLMRSSNDKINKKRWIQ